MSSVQRSNTRGAVNRAPAFVIIHYVAGVFLSVFCLSLPAFSQEAGSGSGSSDTLSPLSFAVRLAEGEDIIARRSHSPRKLLLGKFTVDNFILEPFILRFTFDNGGAFAYTGDARGRANTSAVGMRDFELLYKDNNETRIVKKFADAVSGSNGYVYELLFLREDVQAEYNFELWGRLCDAEAQSAPPGVYREDLRIEVLSIAQPPLTESIEEPSDSTAVAESEGGGLGKRGRFAPRSKRRR